MIISVFLFLLSFGAKSQTMISADYSAPARVQYLNQAIMAFKVADKELINNTQQFLRNQNRYACSAQSEQLKIQCLIQQATASCEGGKKNLINECKIISDVVVSNLIEEKTMLPKNTLNKLLRSMSGSRDMMLNAINGRYARLTSDFILASKNKCHSLDETCLSAEINKFCTERSNRKTIAWQGCAGAIVWFIGSHIKD
jgi:hypothetical protein